MCTRYRAQGAVSFSTVPVNWACAHFSGVGQSEGAGRPLALPRESTLLLTIEDQTLGKEKIISSLTLTELKKATETNP